MKYLITESQLNRVIPLSIRRRLGEIDDALYEMLYNTDIGEAVTDYDREDYIVYVMEYLYDEYFLNLKTSGGEFEALTNLFGNRIGEFWDNHHEETTLMEQRVKGDEVTPGKYLITENRLNDLVYSFLDSKDWYTKDDDGKLDISNKSDGEPVLRYRDRVTDKPTLFISEDLAREVFRLFHLGQVSGLTRIVEWFNEKYDKNLTYNNADWMMIYDEFYSDFDDDEFYYDDDDNDF